METLDELKEIIEDAPEGATHFEECCYLKTGGEEMGCWHDGEEWRYRGDWQVESGTRSLSDIKRIVELEGKLKSFADDIIDCNCLGSVAKVLREYGYE